MRDKKGKSIIAFPDSYTVIDIETTGLSSMWDEIIELAAIKCQNGKPIKTYSTLVKPSRSIDPFISSPVLMTKW